MLEYKTITVPSLIFDDITKKEFRNGIKQSTLDKTIAPIQTAMSAQAAEGWTLHSVECINQRIRRQKSFWEKIFGWIPLVGDWIFPTMEQEVYEGTVLYLYLLTFVKEA